MNIGLRELGWFIRLSRPLDLLGGVFLYWLGVSIVRFLGQPLNNRALWLGLGLTLAAHASLIYLSHFSKSSWNTDLEEVRNPVGEWSWVLGPELLSPKVALYASAVSMTILALLATGAFIQGAWSTLGWITLGLGLALGFFQYMPPFRFSTSGYGEFLSSIAFSTLIPLFGFVIQTDEIHRLVFMVTTPLMALQFSLALNWELPYFTIYRKRLHANLLMRLGWSTTMWLHDFAIVLAFLSLTIGYFFGLSQRIFLGALIALPLGVAQIWQMHRIRSGFPPRWKVFTTSSLGLYALILYLLLLGFLRS